MSAVSRLSTPASGAAPRSAEDHPDYDKLPPAIQLSVTRKEFAWMTDAQRANLTTECTEPEVEG